jgi:hypothetical protein
MRELIAFLILAFVLLTISSIIVIEHQPQKLLIHAAEPATVVPWRLYTTCPLGPQNIPTLPDDRRA